MLDIQQQIISGNKTRRSIKPQWLVVHDTGDEGATAQNEHDYFSSGDRGASADVFIDSNNIIQIIDTDEFYSWAIGDGHGKYGKTNSNSMSFEMSIGNDGQPTEATIQNTLDVVKYFMNKYNIDIDHVVTHHQCSDKNCPASFSSNSWARWYDFKDRLLNGATTISGEWILDTTGYWYKHLDGTYTKNGWEKINSEWYLFDERGYMDYSWKKSEGNWYYLGESNDGSLKTGWIYDKNYKAWFYSNSNGVMLTGWQKISNEWYYFDTTGAMKTEWINDSGKDYLLYSNGVMAHDITIYGYKINSSGQATKI